MITITLILGCLLLYSKSKYFNKDLSYLHKIMSKNKPVTRVFGYLLIATSAILISQYFDVFTGLLVFASALYLCFSLLILLLPTNQKFIYLFGFIGVLSTIIEIFYAS